MLWDFLWEGPREAKYQVRWLWLTLMSNKLITRRRKTCYESEAEPGGSLSLVPTIRSNHSMPEELEKPVGKEWVIVSCLIKVAALCLSHCLFLTKLHYCSSQWFSPWKGSLCQCGDGDYGPQSDLPFLNQSCGMQETLTKPLLGTFCAPGHTPPWVYIMK